MSPPPPASRVVSAVAWHTPELTVIVVSLLLAWLVAPWMALVSIPAIAYLIGEPIVWAVRFRKRAEDLAEAEDGAA